MGVRVTRYDVTPLMITLALPVTRSPCSVAGMEIGDQSSGEIGILNALVRSNSTSDDSVPRDATRVWKGGPTIRAPDGRFAPGTSGGPGRLAGTKGALAYARERTRNGQDLIDVLIEITGGFFTRCHPETGECWVERVSTNQALRAAEILTERLFPRVHQVDMDIHRTTEETGPDLTKLSTDELRTYLKLLAKVQGKERVIEASSTVTPAWEAGPDTIEPAQE